MWHILLAQPAREFRIRDDLIERGVRALVPVELRLGKGKAPVALKRALLPGYVFAEIGDWGALSTLDGLRSRPVLAIGATPAALTQREVNALEALSRPLTALRQQGTRLRPGDRIRIKVGAMADLSGAIDRITRAGKAVALLELFGKLHEHVIEDDSSYVLDHVSR